MRSADAGQAEHASVGEFEAPGAAFLDVNVNAQRAASHLERQRVIETGFDTWPFERFEVGIGKEYFKFLSRYRQQGFARVIGKRTRADAMDELGQSLVKSPCLSRARRVRRRAAPWERVRGCAPRKSLGIATQRLDARHA